MSDNTRVLSNELEDAEFIDQSVWVPKGQEVVPAWVLLNGHAVAQGNHFISTFCNAADRLANIGRIEQQHHSTAIRLINLYRLGTSRQDYAVMKMFMLPSGYDNTDFCPISVFIKVTRGLRHLHMHWVRVLVGIESCEFNTLSANADHIKYALDKISDAFVKYEEEEDAHKKTVERLDETLLR